MAIESLLALIIIGLIAGWLAGRVTQGSGFGFVGNVAVGVAGAFIGSVILTFLPIGASGTLATIVAATIGAIILLVLINLVKR